MDKTDYTELDKLILGRIQYTPGSKFSFIRNGKNINTELQRLNGGERMVDRRLQALKKAGKIQFSNGWYMVPQL